MFVNFADPSSARHSICRENAGAQENAGSQEQEFSAVPGDGFRDPALVDMPCLSGMFFERDVESTLGNLEELFLLNVGRGGLIVRQKSVAVRDYSYCFD